MNVWWCFVSSGARCQHMQGRDGHDKCGLRRLVPVDALVLVREADGRWPEWATQAIRGWGMLDQPVDALDALAAASQEGQ